jgi:hypothetical protein
MRWAAKGKMNIAKTALRLNFLAFGVLFLAYPAFGAAISTIMCPLELTLVCEIHNLDVNDTLYDVTFSNVPDYAFLGSGNAFNALNPLQEALNGIADRVGDGVLADDMGVGPGTVMIAGNSTLSFQTILTPLSFLPSASIWESCECLLPSVGTENQGVSALYAEFQVLGPASPEPGTLATTAIAAALLFFVSKRKHPGFRG